MVKSVSEFKGGPLRTQTKDRWTEILLSNIGYYVNKTLNICSSYSLISRERNGGGSSSVTERKVQDTSSINCQEIIPSHKLDKSAGYKPCVAHI